MAKSALIIFIKNPELGKAKTRLAKDIGDEAALAAYKILLEHTRNTTEEVAADRFLFYSSYIDENDAWSNDAFNKRLQISGRLGEKMQAAFRVVFELGYRKAVIIGSDCGDLRTKHLYQAFECLEEKDIVLGPAMDGGYYLLGMKELRSYLFEDKDWSTIHLFAQTVVDIERHEDTYTRLEELNDIDDIGDWENWQPPNDHH